MNENKLGTILLVDDEEIIRGMLKSDFASGSPLTEDVSIETSPPTAYFFPSGQI